MATRWRRKRVLVLSDLGASFNHGVVRSIARRTQRHGRWQLIIAEPAFNVAFLLKRWALDGLIFRSAQDPWLVRLVRRQRIPVIEFGLTPPDQARGFVGVDLAAAGRLAAQHALERGYRRFGYHGEEHPYASILRDAFLRALKEAGVRGHSCQVFMQTPMPKRRWSLEQRVNDLARWLAGFRPPAAVLVSQDLLAPRVAFACEQLKLRIPEEVGLIGVGNEELQSLTMWPPLTTVELDVERMGQETARLLERTMNGKPLPKEPILVPPRRVIPRGSTDAVAIEDEQVATAMRFMRDHCRQPISVEDVLGQIHISRRSFERRFQRCVGRAPAEEIRRLRIGQVKELLAETDMKIEAIARTCGFTSAQDLWNVFRKVARVSPREYRRKQQQAQP
ncbi:MAG: substrate-binding domain-containing protein [Verrucomicrobia bacterium]|nr:substrate-binding domain-containing protein [Verrucomicrobiota bacterium]